MTKPSRLIAALFALGLLLLLAPLARAADIVTLKTGEKIEGKVTAETDQEVTIEYHVSASITDVRTIPKAEVQSVSKAAPDELLYQSLKSLQPGPNSQPKEYYVSAMKSLEEFLSAYPKSPHVEEVVQQLAAFADEKAKQDAGQVKVAGKWLSKAEVERERYQISGELLFAQMQEDARRGDVSSAMSAFGVIEKNYPGSRAFPDAVELARQILPNFKAVVDRELQSLKTRKAQRDRDLKLVPESERAQVLASVAREEKQGNDAFEAAAKAGQKLAPLIPSSEKCLTQLSTQIPAEEKRLELVPVPKMRQSLQASESGVQAWQQGDFAAAQTSFREATRLWPANEVAVRYSKEVVAKVAPKATPVPPVGAAATPSGVPGPRSASAHGSEQPTPAPVAKPKATPAPVAPIAPPPEEKPAFLTTALGIGAIVVVLAVLIGVAYQARKKKQGDIEVE